MIIDFTNLGGGGGGSYVLPTATDSRLGGVKIGSGVNVDSAGTISVEEYELSAATQNTLGGVKIGSGITVDSAGTISAQGYTLPTASSEVLGGVKVGSGLTITDGVLSANGGGGGDSTALEEITELPESPVDGSVYNYNGVLIKYVDGPGEWGKWNGINATKVYDHKRDVANTAILTYSVIPGSMDGGLICVCHYFSSNYLYSYFDLQNDCINVYTDSASTDTTAYVVNHNGGQVAMDVGLYPVYCEWKNNTIRFTQSNSYALIDSPCEVTINAGHYELTSIPESFISTYDKEYGVIPIVNKNGLVDGYTYSVEEKNVQINGSYQYLLARSSTWNWGSMYVPTQSGATGSLLVSQGNAAPVFKTVSQALGVDFWTGTQDEYDAITTKSATTLYIIIPDNS